MTISDRLNDLITAKEDMKSAIEEKGVEVTSGLTSYADAIKSIEKVIVVKAIDGVKFGYTNDIFDKDGHVVNVISDFKVDLSDVVDTSEMFAQSDLYTISLYNASDIENAEYMFATNYNLHTITGLQDFGKKINLNANKMFWTCTGLTRNCCVNMFNELYDRKGAGFTDITLQFTDVITDRLYNEDIAIATNKGWIISTY